MECVLLSIIFDISITHNENKQLMAKFKKEILKRIESDADLFALVAKEMDVKPTSLAPILWRNGNNLNQYSIVRAVADYLKLDSDQLVEEEVKAA